MLNIYIFIFLPAQPSTIPSRYIQWRFDQNTLNETKLTPPHPLPQARRRAFPPTSYASSPGLYRTETGFLGRDGVGSVSIQKNLISHNHVRQ